MGLDTSWTDAHPWHETVTKAAKGPTHKSATVSTATNWARQQSSMQSSIVDDLMQKSIMDATGEVSRQIALWRGAGAEGRVQILIAIDAINATIGYGKAANLVVAGPKSKLAHNLLCQKLDNFYRSLGVSAESAIELGRAELRRLSSQ